MAINISSITTSLQNQANAVTVNTDTVEIIKILKGVQATEEQLISNTVTTPAFTSDDNTIETTEFVNNRFSWDGSILRIQVTENEWVQVYPPINI